MRPSIPAIPAAAAPTAVGRAMAALVEPPVLEAEALEPDGVEVMVMDSVVGWPLELVVVWAETQEVALLAMSEPQEAPSDMMDEAKEAPSPVREETAAAPPVETALAMEVASATASEPTDLPPE